MSEGVLHVVCWQFTGSDEITLVVRACLHLQLYRLNVQTQLHMVLYGLAVRFCISKMLCIAKKLVDSDNMVLLVLCL